MVLNSIKEGMVKMMSKNFNIFKIVQFIWIVELYFLGLNAVKDVVLNFNIKYNLGEKIILNYDRLVFNYFREYNTILIFIAGSLIIVGFFNMCIREINILRDYRFIVDYCDIGMYLGGWLMLICFTYLIYMWFNWMFIFLFFVIYLFKSIITKIMFQFKNKMNIVQ